ncbi:MspA family porin [Nocardia jiangxiensis]|uniref:MspA family porin n=1 Tax=Nocardia jiangxiensis TaxID=282685 RepID=UPI00030F5958|nr:MspA family porin [Nocardia jiangxiensis]
MRTRLTIATGVVASIFLAFHLPPAAADIVPGADAHEVTKVAPHERTVRTADGRTLVIGARAEQVQRLTVGVSATREALVTDEAYASLSRRGRARLRDGTIHIGYQIGCAVALGKLSTTLGGLISVLGINGAGAPKSAITVTPHPDRPPEFSQAVLYPGIAIQQKISLELDPGTVIDVPLATGPVRNYRALIGVRKTDLRIEGCLGPAAIRSYATLTTTSALSDDTVAVYGDPVTL